MSARQAQRLLAYYQQQAQQTALEGSGDIAEEEKEEDEEDSSIEMSPIVSPKVNTYARAAGYQHLMSSEEEEEDEDEEDEDEDMDDAEKKMDDRVDHEQDVKPPGEVITKRTSKGSCKRVEKDDFDEDVFLNELLAEKKMSGIATTNRGTGHNNTQWVVYQVNLKVLDADKEMSRLFNVRNEDPTVVRRRGRGAPGTGAHGRSKHVRKTWLQTPEDEWPRPPNYVGGGIRMIQQSPSPSVGATDDDGHWEWGCDHFEIQWSETYEKMEAEFNILQSLHDPNVFSELLNKYPYHIQSLLQLSVALQRHGQMDQAASLIKRALYCFELAWCDTYEPSKGSCRMDISKGKNADYFKVLFLHMKQIGRRGCIKSAFEVARLIWSMDPRYDPMGMLLCIDYYALSVRDCTFITTLFESKSPLWSPNSASGLTKSVQDLPGLQFSYALALFWLDNKEDARHALAQSLQKYPQVLRKILERNTISTTTGFWKEILQHRLFSRTFISDASVLELLVEIYVERHYTLWKIDAVLAFLRSCAKLATDRFVETEFLNMEDAYGTESPFHKYKHMDKSDFSDEVVTLPPDNLVEQEHHNMNAEEMMIEREMIRRQNEGNLSAHANPMLLFLQSLLPWNTVQGSRNRE